MTDLPETAAIPLRHRLAVLYLALPLVIWLAGWFEWWFGLPAAAAVAAGVWPALSGSWRTPSWPAAWPALVVLTIIALAWTMVTGAGGFFDLANSDWYKHRAIFGDLARLSWPVWLSEEAASLLRREGGPGDPILRYSLGYYLPPALASRGFGPEALALFVPLWTWGGVLLLLVSFTSSVARGLGKVVAAAAILVFFSGLDVVRVILLEGWNGLGSFSRDGGLDLAWHLESDSHWGLPTQYSSSMTGLVWVPQHFLAAGLGALLLLESRRRPRLLAVAGPVFAAILFWSPFAAVGLLPLAVPVLARHGVRALAGWRNLLLAPLLGVLLAMYLLSDAASIPAAWLWELAPRSVVARWVPLFWLVEFAALAGLLLLCRPSLRREGFFVASVATLFILPLYSLGGGGDLCMRASLPSLLVLCWYTARALVPAHAGAGAVPAPAGPAPVPSGPRAGWLPKGLVVAALSVGAVTPLVEIVRALRWRDPREAAAAMDGPAFGTIRAYAFNYSAHDLPAALRALLKEPPGGTE